MDTAHHDTTLWQDLRSFPREYWILFWGTLVNRFGNFVMPFMTLYLRHENEVGHGHYDERQIGMVLGTYGAGSLFAGILGGYLTDRIGRKKTMMVSCFGGGIFMLLMSQANGLPQMMSCIFVVALLTALYNPAASALIADIVPPHLRVRAYSCQRLAVNLGFAAGMAAAGFMVRRYPFGWLFVGDAVTTLAMGFTAWFGLKSHAIKRTVNHGWSHALCHMRGNPAFILAVAAALFIALAFTQIGTSYGLQATEGLAAEKGGVAKDYGDVFGYLLSLNGLLVVLLELPLTSFTRRFAPPRIIAAGYAIVGIGLGINIFGASIPLLVASMFLITLGEVISFPVSNGYLAGLAPDDMRGRYQGVISMTWSCGTVFGPWAGLQLYGINPTVLWSSVFALAFLSAGLMLATRQRAVVS